MKEWEIWIEGYATNGIRERASLIGKALGDTFDDACLNYRDVDGKALVLDKDRKGKLRRGPFRENLPPGAERTKAIMRGGNYSVWACQLFDNEATARESFG